MTPTTCADIAAALRDAQAEWVPTVGVDRVYVTRLSQRGGETSIGVITVDAQGSATHYLTRDIRAITSVLSARGIVLNKPRSR